MHGEICSILTLLSKSTISDICGAVLFLFVSVVRQCHVPSIVWIHMRSTEYRGIRSTDTYLFSGAFECVRVTYTCGVYLGCLSTAIWPFWRATHGYVGADIGAGA